MNDRVFLSDPKKADVLVVSGAVTKTMQREIEKLHKRMTNLPVLAVGACCLSRGIFYDSESLIGTLDQFFPVTACVFGCPPRPKEILHGILMAKRSKMKAFSKNRD